MVDKDVILQLRWLAESALSGFSDLPKGAALACAKQSLRSIIDTLDQIDRADDISSRLEPRNRDESCENGFHSLDLVNFKQAYPETTSLPSIGYDSGSRQGGDSVILCDQIRLQKMPSASNGNDNVLSFVDGFTKRLLR